LGATPACGSIGLSWTGACGTPGYKVKRSTTSGSGYTAIGTTGGTTYTDTVGSGTYYYVVSATNNAGESANCAQASGAPLVAPSVGAVAPPSQTVAPGGSATFTVSASGSPTLHYQWRKNGSVNVGTDSSSYTISPVASGDAGTYDCVVSGACTPTATATGGTLTVSGGLPPPAAPTISAITFPSGVPTFQFTTQSGYQYRLVRSANVTASLPTWAPVTPPADGWVLASGTSMTLGDTNGVGQVQRFYRVEAKAP